MLRSVAGTPQSAKAMIDFPPRRRCCHLTRAFVADDAVPSVRFRLEGRSKLPAEGSPE